MRYRKQRKLNNSNRPRPVPNGQPLIDKILPNPNKLDPIRPQLPTQILNNLTIDLRIQPKFPINVPIENPLINIATQQFNNILYEFNIYITSKIRASDAY